MMSKRAHLATAFMSLIACGSNGPSPAPAQRIPARPAPSSGSASGSSQPPTAHPPFASAPVPPGATIDRLVAAVASCPHGAKLPRDASVDITPKPPGWELHVSRAPGSRAEGRDYRIDLTTATCDGVAIKLPAAGSGQPLEAIYALADHCIAGPPWKGQGVSSPLISTGVIIHRFAGQLTVEYQEQSPRSKPSGAEVGIDPVTGACSVVGRD